MVWWCIIMTGSVMRKGYFAIFKVTALLSKYDRDYYVSPELLILLCPHLVLSRHYIVKRLWIAVFKFKDTWFKTPLNRFEYYIFCICEYYIFCTTNLLCDQIRCVDVQLLITDQVQTKLVYFNIYCCLGVIICGWQGIKIWSLISVLTITVNSSIQALMVVILLCKLDTPCLCGLS